MTSTVHRCLAKKYSQDHRQESRLAVKVAAARWGGEIQRELDPGKTWTSLWLRIIPRKLQAIIRLAAGLEQIEMDFRSGSSSIRVNKSNTVDADKGLRGISG